MKWQDDMEIMEDDQECLTDMILVGTFGKSRLSPGSCGVLCDMVSNWSSLEAVSLRLQITSDDQKLWKMIKNYGR
jgi:flagellar biosynthesis GTPase FlhF